MSDNGHKTKDNLIDKSVLGKLPIRAWPWPRIMVYIPMFPALPHAPDVFYTFMLIAQQAPDILRAAYQRTDVSRNMAAEKLLEGEHTHILMLDADHNHPVNIIQRLASWVIDDPERLVIGGLNFRRGDPYHPCVGVIGEDEKFYTPFEWDDGLIEVDRLGTGSILIAREVFETLERPWFFYEYDGAIEKFYPSEDYAFSRKCREAGIRLWCDTGAISPHATTTFVDEHTFREQCKLTPELVGEEYKE